MYAGDEDGEDGWNLRAVCLVRAMVDGVEEVVELCCAGDDVMESGVEERERKSGRERIYGAGGGRRRRMLMCLGRAGGGSVKWQ